MSTCNTSSAYLVSPLLAFLIIFLGDNDVRSCQEHSYSSNNGERCESQQAKSIKHHCSKLPIIFDCSCVFVVSYFVGDNSELFQYKTQFSEGTY